MTLFLQYLSINMLPLFSTTSDNVAKVENIFYTCNTFLKVLKLNVIPLARKGRQRATNKRTLNLQEAITKEAKTNKIISIKTIAEIRFLL